MWTLAAVAAVSVAFAPLAAQSANALGSVQLPRKVTADGKALAAGSYTLRLASDAVTAVKGLSPQGSSWVEFVQGGQVKGKELATVVSSADVKTVAKMAPPAAGAAKVQMLKGDEYLRVWVNKGGTHYLIHLAVAK
jgi:hypothetical protein